MKNSLIQKTSKIILLFAILFMNSCGTNKILQKTISHNYFNLMFSPAMLTKQIINETEITITPIDAKSLNKDTYEAASRDGNYEKELATEINQIKSELKKLPKQDRIWRQGQINAIESLTKLSKDNKIPFDLAYKLKWRIWKGEDYGQEGTEITSLSDVENYPEDFNPFKINEKYLSIFKITFENKGKEIEKISLKEFQIVSGEEQLYPLGSDYFENNLKERPESIKNAYRMNMPTELTITPNQRITKYIAVPAINSSNNKLQLQFIRNKKVIDFDFAVTEKSERKSYNLEKYNFRVGGFGEPFTYRNFYVIGYKSGVSFATKESYIYVANEKKNDVFSIYAIGINPNTSAVYFGLNENIKFGEAQKNRVDVDFKRMRTNDEN
jgi:hypothetical protein